MWLRTFLVCVCLCHSLVSTQAGSNPFKAGRTSAEVWDFLQAKGQSARPSSVHKFTDYAIPRDERIVVKCLADRFCNCSATGGHNFTMWLNTGSAVFRGQLYMVILHRKVMYKPETVTYHTSNTSLSGQVVEINHLLLCKAQQADKVVPKDCQLLEPGPVYQEKHPLMSPPTFELLGLIDPRLISAGDDAGLFLQAGCRPQHMSSLRIKSPPKETVCLVKLMGSDPKSPSRRLLSSETPITTFDFESVPARAATLPLPGQATHSRRLQASSKVDSRQRITGFKPTSVPADQWPVGKMVALVHETGPARWEKSWVPFTYQGTLLWSRFLQPHQVVEVHPNGTATTLYETDSDTAFEALKHLCGKGPRGNTQALLLKSSQTGLSQDVYLGTLHYAPHRGAEAPHHTGRLCREYLNFFYLMSGQPPFKILEVSRTPIPLLAATNPIYDLEPLKWGMGYISFPGGMVLQGNQLLITYGSGDREPRVWHAALEDVMRTFSDKWHT